MVPRIPIKPGTLHPPNQLFLSQSLKGTTTEDYQQPTTTLPHPRQSQDYSIMSCIFNCFFKKSQKKRPAPVPRGYTAHPLGPPVKEFKRKFKRRVVPDRIITDLDNPHFGRPVKRTIPHIRESVYRTWYYNQTHVQPTEEEYWRLCNLAATRGPTPKPSTILSVKRAPLFPDEERPRCWVVCRSQSFSEGESPEQRIEAWARASAAVEIRRRTTLPKLSCFGPKFHAMGPLTEGQSPHFRLAKNTVGCYPDGGVHKAYLKNPGESRQGAFKVLRKKSTTRRAATSCRAFVFSSKAIKLSVSGWDRRQLRATPKAASKPKASQDINWWLSKNGVNPWITLEVRGATPSGKRSLGDLNSAIKVAEQWQTSARKQQREQSKGVQTLGELGQALKAADEWEAVAREAQRQREAQGIKSLKELSDAILAAKSWEASHPGKVPETNPWGSVGRAAKQPMPAMDGNSSLRDLNFAILAAEDMTATRPSPEASSDDHPSDLETRERSRPTQSSVRLNLARAEKGKSREISIFDGISRTNLRRQRALMQGRRKEILPYCTEDRIPSDKSAFFRLAFEQAGLVSLDALPGPSYKELGLWKRDNPLKPMRVAQATRGRSRVPGILRWPEEQEVTKRSRKSVAWIATLEQSTGETGAPAPLKVLDSTFELHQVWARA